MVGPAKPTRRIGAAAFARLLASDALAEPVIVEGAAAGWPLVAAGERGMRAAMDYLLRFASERPVVCYEAPPELRGRFFYDETATRMTYQAARRPLREVLADIERAAGEARAPAYYVGSTDAEGFFPGLLAENPLPLPRGSAPASSPTVSLWIGNRTTACAHFDASHNVAVCAVGRRRFTLFPPAQAANLYPGPLEPTPGGQVISMVDAGAPDLDAYPRFAEALAAGQVAELGPGDLLAYPALWWHQVDATCDFNVLVNAWWNPAPGYLDDPWATLLHGMLSLRDRPRGEKEAWRALFDYYVFGEAERPAAHLPEAARGPLAPLTESSSRRLRRMVLAKLNR